ncbi:MAG: hypothetical protein IKO35_00235 [Elusimicrobiaceae bacterium]|nr:hypothetical protein [Elusimicrobiaceae bacterium]
MSYGQFFRTILLIALMAGLYLSVGDAWEIKDVMRIMFSDKPRFSEPAKSLPAPKLPPAQDQESQRGRAQELRPDINVPPPAEETQNPAKQQNGKLFEQMISGLEAIASVSSTKGGIEEIPTQAIRPLDSFHKVRWSPPPPGFLTADTFNYLIYREKNPVTSNIKTILDTIHGNLMLDLTPFTVLVKPNKILVMLFDKKESYQQFTHLPPWSGASSDLQSDTMYVIEGNSFYALSVHELTHLYFDGYFLPTISPLWLSEGMAVYMQIYASKQRPSWIDHSLRRILSGDIIPLEEMTTTEDLNSYDTSKAELWYTQAYSIVDYLLNKRTRDEFYKFCNELKNKTPLHQALYRAYGMPFNKVSVLQNVWLYDLQKEYREGRLLTTQAPSAITVKQLPPADGIVAIVSSSDTKANTNSKQTVAVTPTQTVKQTPKAEPVKTKINKLEIIPTNGYKGGF